ncbi:hypothetical protein CAB88_32035 (plasmid) [Bacillus thuringiensis]|uniref:Uncharacterized protein n=4 Tax=Bacillus thuringiensis TaxID=1428 RepID=A0A9W4AFF0_BACTO|nr:hypothetical protein pBMB0558_00510 [Bacillus thuringiensis serovar chinensis CT-43]ARP61639.1 hypothetical protein CAB88_32035 [Bacillus thuringiensis]OTW39984.1 hypothetical protein BK698_18805 [Bacillus thuringiensis serovar thuringiensis]OTZ99832.1 hypothetical protein BK789_04145 [Bacillus thuringiensis serovar darmstadiensis]BAR87574.1 uncharacterized protein KNN_06841 [Bacillus thuringiensis serovar tolworthi]
MAGSSPLIISIFIFSIVTLATIIVLWLKTKQLYVPDIIRLTGAIICLISSGILLMFKDKFEPTYKNLTSTIGQYTGTSLNIIILCLLGFFLLIAIFNAIRL